MFMWIALFSSLLDAHNSSRAIKFLATKSVSSFDVSLGYPRVSGLPPTLKILPKIRDLYSLESPMYSGNLTSGSEKSAGFFGVGVRFDSGGMGLSMGRFITVR